MRLLVVTQYFWPEDFRINELVAELSARGHQITVLTGRPNYPGGTVFSEYTAEPGRFSSFAGAAVIRVPLLARGRGKLRLVLNYLTFAVSATIVGVTRFRRDQFDAMFVFQVSPITVGIPAITLRALRGWPIVLWVLDQWPESLEAVGAVRSPRILAMVGRLARFIYDRCDVILSPSRLLMPRIASYCGRGQRLEYFPNWVESAYEQAAVSPAEEVPEQAGSFSVLFAGNIGDAQDFPTILEAAELLRQRTDVRWIIVGDGRVAPWLRDEIDRRGLASSVLMLGRFPPERMPSFFAHADALLVALRPEPVFAMTAPGKIQSYLAVGRPVLAMLDGEGAAVIDDARAGLTSAAGDARRLADNVARLAAMTEQERKQLGENGAAYARREFRRDDLVDRLEGWLRDVVRLRPAS